MTDRAIIDIETRSRVDIKHGTYAYAAAAEVLLLAYKINDEPTEVWDVTEGVLPPPRLIEAIKSGVPIIAHNAQFERAVLSHCDWLSIPITQWRCSMARALAHGLPGGLGHLAEVLRVPEQKMEEGSRLIRLFCVPPAKNLKRRDFATRETHPKDWETFKVYCAQDVNTTEAVWQKMPDWNYREGHTELALWHLDQVINDRGFAVDTELARAAVTAIDEAQERLAERTQELTDEAVASATQRGALLGFINETYGLALPDLTAATVEKALAGGYHGASSDLPAPVAELLSVRLQTATSSTAKYKKVLQAVNEDGRLRGSLQYHAARPGRWGGRVFQPQNLPRPMLAPEVIEQAIADLKAGIAGLVYA